MFPRFRFVFVLGIYATEEQLMEVVEYSKVLNIPNNFLESDFDERSINIILYPERLENESGMMRKFSCVLMYS